MMRGPGAYPRRGERAVPIVARSVRPAAPRISTTSAINNINAVAHAGNDYIAAPGIFDHAADPPIVDKYFKDVAMTQLRADAAGEA